MPASRKPLPPSLDGELRFDDQARTAAADDFGRLVHRAPEAVLLPASEADVAATVRWAAATGRGFAAQGSRHSVFGRAQMGDGIVAAMRRLRAVHDLRDDRVVVDAGATWREVLAATLPRGLAPPVVPDYLDLTVGGTLAVGGVGSRTWRSGVVADNVLELRVVTGRRGLVTANRAVYERVRDAGGTLYPVSAFPMSRADWRSHFGKAFGPLAEAKDEHDPGRVLRPGYEVF